MGRSIEGLSGFLSLPLEYHKTFGPEFWDASVHQLEVIVDELKYWDASMTQETKAIRFFTSIKESA